EQSYRVGPLSLPKPQVYGFVAAVLVLVALYLVLTRTWTGRAIRACSQNPSGAALVGVGAASTAALAFALGAATAGVGGSVLSVLFPFFPASHYDWISRLLGIIVLGGMGSLPGAMVGALVLGLAETLTATYASLAWSTLVFYLVIMAVLLVRPQGLFGTRLREDTA
ncbi:MAG TPA: branched-chain amino acid ABC transporter permease, partial [Mycobacteriales bacterium]|nr:branched-chain amino acid ABC transporter permease [Mycobacteriales bacterium]